MKNNNRTFLALTAALALGAPAASASDLNLSIQSGGSNVVSAVPGETLSYQVIGELSDGLNEGLALFCFDLSYTGGSLAPAASPSVGPLLEFDSPRGMTNPAGFGGTPQAGGLLQVGGAQNTIKSTFAPRPNGVVVTGVGAPGAPVVLAAGTVSAPNSPGNYVLSLDGVVANVIRQGENGSGPFWAVDAAGTGTVQFLTIQVADCAPVIYCTAKVNSQGCTPNIGSSGTASLSGGGFTVTCGNVINKQFGQWYWGTQADNMPFQGGIRCVAAPIQRTQVVASGGTQGPPDCSGNLSFTLTPAFMLSKGFAPGTQVYGQWWYRDPLHLDGTGIGLSDALEFTVCP